MGDGIWSRTASTHWPLAYLIVTAISAGVLVGVWHWFPDPTGRYELVPVGFVAVVYTVTSALHYYQTTRQKPPRGATAIDEW